MSKFEKAKPEDLETIASIEKEFFGDYEKAFDLEFSKNGMIIIQISFM